MFSSVIGHAEGLDTASATKKVIEQCRQQLKDFSPSAGILFASLRSDYDVILESIRTAFPGLPLAGCSAAGEMSAICGFRQDSICLLLFATDSIRISSGCGPNASLSTERAVQTALNQALDRLDGSPSLCIAFANNLTSCPVDTVNILHEKLDKNCPVFGGYAASDAYPQTEIYQFHDGQVHSDAVSILLFSGPVKSAFCISNSWNPIGPRSYIEKTNGNSVMRIGGKSALKFYHDTFGPHSEPMLEMPLAIYDTKELYYIRVANEFDLTQESVQFDSALPEGAMVQFTETSGEDILADSAQTLAGLTSGLDWTPRAGLVISCVARKTVLGLQAHKEAQLIKEHLPDNLPFAGFYSYGELAPPAEGRDPRYHNFTMVTLLIGEKGFNRPPDPINESCPLILDEQDKDQTIALLQQRLERARKDQARLEHNNVLSRTMQHRINEELANAKNKIEEQHQILKESLTLAQQVQQRLLPKQPPRFPGFEIAGRSVYCDETGGDYFDYMILPEEKGKLSVVVGDVAGHGIASALLMATARALLRMRISKSGSPAQVISDLNRFLSIDIQDTGQFMTLFYLVLDTMEPSMTWVRAGHDPALRYVPSQDSFELLKGEGLVLGVLDDWQYQEYKADMGEPGEIILIGTDGIWETRDNRRRFFGKERFMDVIRKHKDKSAQEIIDACFQSVARFRTTLPVHDDITLVVIKKNNQIV